VTIARLAFTLTLALALIGSANAKHPVRPEQLHFSAEDEGVRHPVAIPTEVLAILGKDEMVKDILEDQNVSADTMPPSWFSASVVHLSANDEADLIVEGEPPVVGANITPFWVFCATDHGYELVLTARAHDLEVKKRRWKGHHVIVMSGETAVVFTGVEFRWNGNRYTEFREKSENLR
jgi:hypothetical protein